MDSGTTSMPWAATSSSVRSQLLSVTILTPAMRGTYLVAEGWPLVATSLALRRVRRQ